LDQRYILARRGSACKPMGDEGRKNSMAGGLVNRRGPGDVRKPNRMLMALQQMKDPAGSGDGPSLFGFRSVLWIDFVRQNGNSLNEALALNQDGLSRLVFMQEYSIRFT
jgi:hypothetical protein